MLRTYALVNTVHGSSLQFLSTAALALLLCDPCATVTKDPDDIGIVQWRPAFYVVGDLGNAFPPVLIFPHFSWVPKNNGQAHRTLSARAHSIP